MHLVSVIRCTIIAPTGQHSVARDNTPGIANDNHKPQRGGIYVSITITSVSPFDFLDEKPGGVAESRNPQRTPRLHRRNRERTKRVLLQAGSVEDHIHLLLTHPRTISPAKLVQEIKTGSSKWIKTKGVRFTKFAWQTGYGIFSISPSHQQAVVKYIENQAEHHRNNSFQDEYRNLLAKYNVPFDERYVWD